MRAVAAGDSRTTVARVLGVHYKVREQEKAGLSIVAEMDRTIEQPYEPEKLVGKHPEP